MCQVLKVRRECLYTSKGTMDEDLGYFKAGQTYNGQRGEGSGKKGNLVAATVASLRQLCISTSLCIALRTPSGPNKWKCPLGRGKHIHMPPLHTKAHLCQTASEADTPRARLPPFPQKGSFSGIPQRREAVAEKRTSLLQNCWLDSSPNWHNVERKTSGNG